MIGDNMLEKFSVKNYKNFKDEITVDFKEKHDYQFNKNCIKDGVLNKVIIFGNNGEGKSNIGYAIFDIVGTLTDKYTIPPQANDFLNADSDCKEAEFSYTFKFGNIIVQYNYKKSEFKKMTFEELYINNEKVYEYDFVKKSFNHQNMEMIEAETLNFEYYEANIAVLRYVANNTTQTDESIVKKIMQFVTKMLWFRSLRDNSFIGMEIENTDIAEWIISNNLVKEFNKFLIENANLNLNVGNAELMGTKNTNILIEKHKHRPLVFNNVASSGTNSLLLYFYWYKHFKDVKFLFIDEFDAFYHFELSINIIKHLIEYENMQTVLTSHNTIIADNNLLRPDCYFILKDGALKSFADSTDRELREGHNLEKMLRQGEFNE
ncbi:MAG: AAA family ATPase [Clostridia bacterium]|nr:AAA family ATPase [Clostridia bacterium]